MRHLGASAVLLDFDGTLGPIVSRPELAKLQPGAAGAIERLVSRVAVVAIVSGRPGKELAELVRIPGVQLVGLYGGEQRIPAEVPVSFVGRVEAIARSIEGTWVERKGPALAIHYRASPDPDATGRTLERTIAPIAQREGFDALPGKRVLDLVPTGSARKGDAVRRIAGKAAAVLYAGDDLQDLPAFEALDAFEAEGTPVVRVGVRGTETPLELVEASDIVVEGPAGLVDLLDELTAAPGSPEDQR